MTFKNCKQSKEDIKWFGTVYRKLPINSHCNFPMYKKSANIFQNNLQQSSDLLGHRSWLQVFRLIHPVFVWLCSGPEPTTEGKKKRHILFKAFTYDSYMKKKIEMGFEGITNSEISEVLLHTQLASNSHVLYKEKQHRILEG